MDYTPLDMEPSFTAVIGGMWKQTIFVTVHAVIIFCDSDVENTFFFPPYIPSSFLSINQIIGTYHEYVEMVASKAFHNKIRYNIVIFKYQVMQNQH